MSKGEKQHHMVMMDPPIAPSPAQQSNMMVVTDRERHYLYWVKKYEEKNGNIPSVLECHGCEQ